MEKEIVIGKEKIKYVLRKNSKAKNIKLAVRCNGKVIVTVPRWLNSSFADSFIKEKSDWLLEKRKEFEKNKDNIFLNYDSGDYLKNKKEAYNSITERLEYYNSFYNFPFNKIFIKNQTTRWGSCSIKGNLNFNYKLLFFPKDICDYIVVHELCHLKELNHSKNFWNLVEKTIPDYRKIRQKLRNYLR